MKSIVTLIFLPLVCIIPQFTHASELDEVAKILNDVTGKKVRNYSTRDFGREKYLNALSVLIPAEPFTLYQNRPEYEQQLRLIRNRLPKGFVAFIGTTNHLGTSGEKGIEIVVAPGEDQFAILETAATDAVNYDMVTDDLIEKLEVWDSKYGIDIWQAETDTIQLKLLKLPKDVKSFAEEVYKFCPDIVDQGIGTVSALEKEIKRTKELFLWWD
jgi:hypothetical protein